MSDIRFNQWLHQSGTGGVSQVASGAVGVGTTNPLADFYVRGDAQITGILTAGHIAMGSSITFGDDDRAYFGDGTDLQIYHSGSHSFIQDTGTGNLFIDSNSVQIRNAVASKTTAKFIENAQVELYYNNTERIRTTNTGAVVTGILTATGMVKPADGIQLNGGNISLLDRPDGSSHNLFFGTGAKAAIYHDGSGFSIVNNTGHTYIGVGVASKDLMLYAQASGNVLLQQNTGVRYVKGVGSDASVQLFFNNNEKLKTTNTGINVTGILTATDLKSTNFVQVLGTAGTSDKGLEVRANSTQNTDTNQAIRVRNNSNTDTFKVSYKGYVNNRVTELTEHLTTPTTYLGDSIIHHGDLDTKIRFPSNDTIAFETDGDQRLRIYNDGIVAIGQSAKSNTVGAGNLDIQGNGTSCIIEMGNPFPNYSGGIVPEFRITATNSGHTVDFESVWGGDNLLHKHLSFSGGSTTFHKGINDDEIARFTSSGQLILNSTSVTNSNDYFTVTRPASGFNEMSMTVDANTTTGTHANAFVFTKSKNTYWTGLGFQSSHGHIGAIVGKRDSTGGDSDQEIRIEIGGTHINQSEEKTWNFKNNGDLSISDGNLVVASGHGIDFSATSNASNASASMSSELFDDYEEGTFTPTDISGHSITITNNNPAQYTKIGRLVHVTFDCTWASGHSGGGNASISLPYAMGEEYGSGSVGWNQVNKPLQVHVNSSGLMIMENYSNGSGARHLSNSSASGNRIIGDATYFTSS